MSIREDYNRRREERLALAAELDRREARLSDLRTIVFVIGGVMVWAMLGPKVLHPAWLIAPVLAFGGLVLLFERTRHRRVCAQRGAAFFERGLQRLDGTWAGKGEMGLRHADSKHLYSDDLDLFGTGSLFELLATTRTRSGEAVLARWLKTPASAGEAMERRAAVRELAPRVELREDLALLGDEARNEGDPETLIAWAEAPPPGLPSWAVQLASSAAGLSILSVAAWASGFSFAGVLGAFLYALMCHWVMRKPVSAIVDAIESRGRDVSLLAEVFERMERERFESPRLTKLRLALGEGGATVSRELGRLRRLVGMLDTRRNQLFHPIALAVCWVPLVAAAVERWRREHGPRVRGWLEAMGEIEALSAVAAYAAEHADDAWPEFVEGARLEAEGIGHPLIAADRCVRNDVRMGGAAPVVLVVSGSNMSGKSTLLRTTGVAVILAWLGAPVRAKSMRLGTLALAASIRRNDSLQEGTSRFYAEIKRIKEIVDLAGGPVPALFLIDEILHGTNSKDRAAGSAAVVRGLVSRGAIGLVTTHDLALASVADELAPKAANVHFEDRLENGKMTFDYVLRPGPVKRGNALELMRAMGLEV